MKQIMITFFALVASLSLFAQSETDLQYQNAPLWIQMMDVEHVNYYEAIKAFNLYWQNREKPTTENEMFSASNDEKAATDFVQKKKHKKEQAAIRYAFEYKKFIRWQTKVQDYLNADGTVMNAEERIAAWTRQLENRK